MNNLIFFIKKARRGTSRTHLLKYRYSMMKNVTESLAGRVAVLDLKGFSLKEIENEGQNPFIPTNDFIEK